ncbi:MAG: peptide-methionine (S)-S-oxide reductase, partial [Desulfobacterales bacterium]
MGYAGGTKEAPTYHSLGDHTETIQIDYDPSQVSYNDLLDIFWQNHDPSSRAWSKQYMAAVFYHTDEQKKLAEES